MDRKQWKCERRRMMNVCSYGIANRATNPLPAGAMPAAGGIPGPNAFQFSPGALQPAAGAQAAIQAAFAGRAAGQASPAAAGAQIGAGRQQAYYQWSPWNYQWSPWNYRAAQPDADDCIFVGGVVVCPRGEFSATVLEYGGSDAHPLVLVTSPAFNGARWVRVVKEG